MLNDIHELVQNSDGSLITRKQFEARMKPHFKKMRKENEYLYDCPAHPGNNLHFHFHVAEDGVEHTSLQRIACDELDIKHNEHGLVLKSILDGSNSAQLYFDPYHEAIGANETKYFFDAAGQPLLYEGGIHIFYGKPGTFKSWAALMVLAAHDAKYWDFENGPYGLRSRLALLRIPSENARKFAKPQTLGDVQKLVDDHLAFPPEIVCIDGFSGLAAAMGLDPESNQDVMQIFNTVLNPLRASGITVVILDHLPKDSSTEDYPIGAQQKKAQADVALLFKLNPKTNKVGLYLTKDRSGQLLGRSEPGQSPRQLAYLETSFDGVARIEIIPMIGSSINGVTITKGDAELKQAIYDYVEANPKCSKSAIETNVPGQNARKRKAHDSLVGDGFIVTESDGVSIKHVIALPLVIDTKLLGS